MATFPSVTPSYGARKRSSPQIQVAQFGDGYSQRLKFGLNTSPKDWSLRWDNISDADADSIETFLEARGDDGASFDWTPLDESTSYKWICLRWQRSINYKGRASIDATFFQVFEP